MERPPSHTTDITVKITGSLARRSHARRARDTIEVAVFLGVSLLWWPPERLDAIGALLAQQIDQQESGMKRAIATGLFVVTAAFLDPLHARAATVAVRFA